MRKIPLSAKCFSCSGATHYHSIFGDTLLYYDVYNISG